MECDRGVGEDVRVGVGVVVGMAVGMSKFAVRIIFCNFARQSWQGDCLPDRLIYACLRIKPL